MAMFRRHRRGKSRYSYRRPPNPRIQKIQTFAKSPALFYAEMFADASPHTESSVRIKELISYSPEHIKVDAKFHKHLGIALVSLLNEKISVKQKGWNGREKPHTYEYPTLIQYCIPFIDEDAKSKVIDLIIKHNRNFYSTGRKELATLATEFTGYEDNRAFDILQDFCRTIKPNDFNKLMSKIPKGTDNPKVKEILSKTKLFDYLKYDETTVNSSYEEKVKLVKAVAKTPTLIKRLPFVLKVELKHLKEVAPAMRFKFMQFAFKYEFYNTRHGWNHGAALQNRIDYSKKRVKEDKLIIEEVSVEDMKELLFSVCLQKNAEFVKWITSYEIYLASKHSTIRIDLSQYKR